MSTEFGYIGGNAPTQSGQNNSGLINPKDMYNLVTTDKLKFDSMYRHILTEEISGSPSTLDYTDSRLTKYPNLIDALIILLGGVLEIHSSLTMSSFSKLFIK